MKKNYVYAAVLLLLALLLGLGSWLFMEYRPVKYENGTFVKLPQELLEKRELSA